MSPFLHSGRILGLCLGGIFAYYALHIASAPAVTFGMAIGYAWCWLMGSLDASRKKHSTKEQP